MELSLHRLRILHEFSRRGTVTETAAVLHYTTSAISQQLDAMEREVGLELLERVGRRVRLTEAGRVLAEQAAEVLVAEERARLALERAQEALTAKLTVGVLATIAASLVPPTLAILAERHPEMHVRTREVTPEEAVTAVRDGDLDLAFVLDYPDSPTSWDLALESTLVGVEQLRLVVPGGRCDFDGPVALTDLADHSWVVSGDGTDFGRALLAVCRRAGFEPRVTHQVDEQATAMAMVAGGLGITLVADLGRALRPAGVDVVPLHDPLMRRVLLLRRAATRDRPSERAFLDAALEAASSLGLERGGTD
ncbi:DNA-binding transcriptional LysR family regulator [Saccharopolyspora lacisalsi]|uniref:DNA-binding transcriptional LysR family regulator n=1 Tax=Halosaccharopolyspora lacisalsi TaxID=1000566 RepID=A0A839E5T5_9PSEU|nr:LysR family transcriptional regulator [Halosaccharopolyspora lacisalsi]MBA8826248.1 DNA-binding transcriptional LysR family regulator [Halosaccharopolyspora lacisalsi]